MAMVQIVSLAICTTGYTKRVDNGVTADQTPEDRKCESTNINITMQLNSGRHELSDSIWNLEAKATPEVTIFKARMPSVETVGKGVGLSCSNRVGIHAIRLKRES